MDAPHKIFRIPTHEYREINPRQSLFYEQFVRATCPCLWATPIVVSWIRASQFKLRALVLCACTGTDNGHSVDKEVLEYRSPSRGVRDRLVLLFDLWTDERPWGALARHYQGLYRCPCHVPYLSPFPCLRSLT